MFKTKKSKNLALHVSYVTIFINAILSLGKLLAGIIGHSSAMISDAIHSASDVLSTIIVIIGVKLSHKKPDKEHPYGHERFECVASIILSIMLAFVGLEIGIKGIDKILSGNYENIQIPTLLPLIAAIVSIVTKEWMFWYTRSASIKTHSGALMADAWHHRSDALSSVGAFIGILFARLGYPIMDAIASMIISLCILKAAYDIFSDSINKMIDHSCDEDIEKQILSIVKNMNGIEHIDLVKTRLFGSKIYVDIEISVNGYLTLIDSHEIAEKVHTTIENSIDNCAHCMVHVNPYIPCS